MTPESSSELSSDSSQRATDAFARLVAIIARLRARDGCPWDREQNHLSLRRHLIEEAYEVLGAIENGDDSDLQEELGDLLMQPVMHAQIATEENRFDIADVIEGISEKLVRRHPHVFGEVVVSDSGEVLRNWDAIKKDEKEKRIAAGSTPGTSTPGAASILAEISSALPALMLALDISKKAAKAGFEWPDANGVLEKAREEIGEVEEAMSSGDKARVSEEIGDFLFTVVNLARWQKIDPELALRDMTRRFQARFAEMEKSARERNLKLENLSPAQWDELWNEAKTKLNK